MIDDPDASDIAQNAVVSALGSTDRVRTLTGVTRVTVCLDAGDDSFAQGVNTAAVNSLFSVSGGDGNGTIRGEGGDDQLYGEAGNDVLIGGDGTGIIDGGPGVDTCSGGGEYRNCEIL